MDIYTAFEQLRDAYTTMSEDPAYSFIEQATFDQVATNIDNVLCAFERDEVNDGQA